MADMADTLIALLTSVFTGVSVLVAIWVYRRTEDQREFAAFRLSLVDMRQNISELDGLLAEPLFTEVGLAISEELGRLFPGQPSKAELKQYICDERHHNFIAQAIHTGRLKSSTWKRCERLMAEIERSPFVYREQLPVVSRLLYQVNDYILMTARAVALPGLFNEIIGKPDRFSGHAKGRFDTDEVSDAGALRFIAIMLTAAPTKFMEAKGQKVFDAAEELMTVVVDRYTSMTDRELRVHGRRQRRMLKKIEEIREEKQVRYAFECFKLIRGVFSQDRWDDIVSNVTKVDQNAHSETTERSGP
jgi:hypothetical protein